MRIVWSWLREFCPTEQQRGGPRGTPDPARREGRGSTPAVERRAARGRRPRREGARTIRIRRSSPWSPSTTAPGSMSSAPASAITRRATSCRGPRPGARVPVLPEPLAPREIGGIVSNGMLCSPRELALADVHTGILVLNAEAVAPARTSSRALGLDDEVLDIEVEPNRPDFLSVLGVAREVVGAHGSPLVDPLPPLEETREAAGEVASIRIDALDGCPRYVARVIRGIGGRTTPIRAQARLTACGMRPISAGGRRDELRDARAGTAPARLRPRIGSRGPASWCGVRPTASPCARSTASTGRWAEGDLLICDVERPVAIAGVMGGATSEVAGETVDVLLESRVLHPDRHPSHRAPARSAHGGVPSLRARHRS